MNNNKIARVLLPGVSVIFCAASVAAQTEIKQASAAPFLEEVLVVAQKRAESLQDVPIAITAVTSQGLERSGITGNMLDLQMVTPGLRTAQVVSGYTPTIRGVGTSDTTVGNENPVSVFVDGMYLPGAASGLLNLTNSIERVEVLKGPQGTLFGRNTTGGVIHVITKDPGDEPVGELSLEYGNYDRKVASIYGTTPITDTVASNLAVRWEDQTGGWGDNELTGYDIYEFENVSVRNKWLITPGESTTIRLSADYYRYENLGPPFRKDDGGDFYSDSQDANGEMTSWTWGVGANIQHDMDVASFVSITSYRKVEEDDEIDFDMTTLPIFFVHNIMQSKVFTQEFQLLSPESSRIKWITGLYYLTREARSNPNTNTGLALSSPPVSLAKQEIYTLQDTSSYAVFAQATWPLTENTNVTGGLRYTNDKQDYEGYNDLFPVSGTPPVIVTPTTKDDLKSDKVTYRLVLDHHFNADVMAYLSYNTGYKSGYYGLTSAPSSAADPETVDAVEIGLKSQLMNGRVRLNLAAYHYEYDDIQTLFIIDGKANTVNAGSAKIDGIELEAIAVPLDNWNVNFGFNWMPRAKYGSFTPCPGPLVVQPGPYDCSDTRMINTPKWDVNLGTDYTIPSTLGDFNLSIAYAFVSKFPWEADFGPVPGYSTSVYEEPAYSLVNVRAGWESPEDTVNAAIWVRNAGDTEYQTNGGQAFGFGAYGYPGAPRTYGVTVGYNF